jgi:hypothetical protein
LAIINKAEVNIGLPGMQRLKYRSATIIKEIQNYFILRQNIIKMQLHITKPVTPKKRRKVPSKHMVIM